MGGRPEDEQDMFGWFCRRMKRACVAASPCNTNLFAVDDLVFACSFFFGAEPPSSADNVVTIMFARVLA